MDRTMRILLSLGIAILYPVVIYFMVVTIIPKASDSQYPTYPTCYRGSGYRYEQNDCDREYREYDRKIESYHDSFEREESKNLTRAQIGLGLALLTMIGVVFIRDVKEVVAGMTVGATLVVITAGSVLISGAGDDPTTGNALLVLLCFIFLTALLFITEKALPESVSAAQHVEQPEQ
jgi:hypothetical protein